MHSKISSVSQPGAESDSRLSERFQTLAALFTFIGDLQRLDTGSEAVRQICARLPEIIRCKDVAIFLLNNHNEQLELVASSNASTHVVSERTEQASDGIIAACVARRELQIEESGERLALAIPIQRGWQLLGALYLRLPAASIELNLQREYLCVLTDTLGHKLAMEQTIEALESSVSELSESQQRLNAFFRVAQLNEKHNQEESFYRELHAIIRDYINTESIFICLHDRSSDKLWLPYLHDRFFGEHFEHRLNDEERQRSLAMRTIEQNKTCLYQYRELKELQQNNQLVLLERIPYSWLSVPFRVNNEVRGAVTLQSYRRNLRFAAKDEHFLNFLASHISNAINRKLQAQRLHHLALHDSATGLPNRALFVDRLEHALAKNARHHTRTAVLFVDLDNFKQVNDQFGHQAGDHLLKQAALRMQSELREEDTLARLGGDEFAIIIEPCDGKRVAINAASRILSSLAKPFHIDNHAAHISSSIGIAFNERAESASELLNHADHAMYHAKRAGKNRYQVFESSLYRQLQNTRQLIEELEQALEKKELLLHYQPILDLKRGEVLGFEALLRWQHPQKGLIPPGEFIEAAERSNLIKGIDQQIMHLAAQQVVQWRQLSGRPVYVSINISSQRFAEPRFVQEVAAVIEQYQVPEGALVLEITEHLLMDNFAVASQTMRRLQDIGVLVSLDDFGTGYSSLSYLNRLSFDLVKIDRSFISQMNELESDYPIISTIIALSRTLGMKVIAEGIENPVQLKLLKQLSCWLGQGYFIARPMTPSQTTELLLNQQLLAHIANED